MRLGSTPVPLQPLCDRQEIRVRNRVGVAHDPWAPQHLPFDQVEAGTDRLRDLALHIGKGGRFGGPAVAAHPVGVGDIEVSHKR